jgi:Co/Zn/Cd efflux system component
MSQIGAEARELTGDTPGAERGARKRRLRGALILTLTFLAIEVAGGLLSGSLALLADAAHMFTDVAALILAWAAMTLAERSPTTRYTFGLYRAEILAAFVNAEILLVIAGWIFYEAYRRLQRNPHGEDTATVLQSARAATARSGTSRSRGVLSDVLSSALAAASPRIRRAPEPVPAMAYAAARRSDPSVAAERGS